MRIPAFSRVMLIAFVLPLFSVANAPANIFGDIWGGIKTVAGAPFDLVGSVLGSGVSAAADPVIDNVFTHVRTSTDYAADRFQGVFDTEINKVDVVTGKRIDQIDEIAGKRIDQIDKLTEKKLNEVDQMLDDKIGQIEKIADRDIEKTGIILDQSINKVDAIGDKDIGRIEKLSDRSLTKVANIETDAGDRVDSSLQDQVPFMTSILARQLERSTICIVFVVVVVGFWGFQLYRKMSEINAEGEKVWESVKAWWLLVRVSIFNVGIPLLVVAVVIQLGYECYANRADAQRVERLVITAKMYESISDYTAAANFRRRALALKASKDGSFQLLRDQWLASFTQSHSAPDIVQLSGDLSHIITSYGDQAKADRELDAIRIYLTATYTGGPGRRAGSAPVFHSLGSTDIHADIKTYEGNFLSGSSDTPTYGKLVYMAHLRLLLNDPSKAPTEKVEAAMPVADSLVQKYPTYAAGHVLRANLQAMRAELLNMGPDQTAVPSAMSDQIKSDRDAAEAQDPDLVRFVQLILTDLPGDIKSLVVQQARKQPLSSDDMQKLKSALDQAAAHFVELGQPLYGWRDLSRARAEQLVLRALWRSVVEANLQDAIDKARGALNQPPATSVPLCVTVANIAQRLNKPLIATAWLDRAQSIESSKATKVPSSDDDIKTLRDLLCLPVTGQMFLCL